MWINEISIDKRFLTEYDYILTKLDKINSLSYTKETTKDRFVCALATTDENSENVKEKLLQIVSDVILVFLKRRIVFEDVNISIDSYSKVALLSSIIYFDSFYEQKFLLSKMDDIVDYNIDAILNFRLKKLIRNWQELKGLTKDLLVYADEGDLTYITSVMNNSAKEKTQDIILTSSGGKLRLFSKENKLDILPIYDNIYYNILDKIIHINPSVVMLKDTKLPREMTSLLKKILLVKYT